MNDVLRALGIPADILLLVVASIVIISIVVVKTRRGWRSWSRPGQSRCHVRPSKRPHTAALEGCRPAAPSARPVPLWGSSRRSFATGRVRTPLARCRVPTPRPPAAPKDVGLLLLSDHQNRKRTITFLAAVWWSLLRVDRSPGYLLPKAPRDREVGLADTMPATTSPIRTSGSLIFQHR